MNAGAIRLALRGRAPRSRAPGIARRRPAPRRDCGQALVLVVALLCLVLAGALVLGSFARALGDRGHAQRAADLGALAGAKAMRSLYGRLFVPAIVDGAPNPQHVGRAAYLAAGRRTAIAV